MRHLIFWIVICCLFTACASTHPTEQVHTPISLTLEADDTPEFWQLAAHRLKQNVPEYDIQVLPSQTEYHQLNRIHSESGSAQICMAPKANFDFAGNLTEIHPLYCSPLNIQTPETSLEQHIQTWQTQTIRPHEGESDQAFRNRILDESTPDNPVCFSIFPDLFASGIQLPLLVEENYLLACAKKIDAPQNNLYSTPLLATWLRSMASLLSDQHAFVARTFRSILSDNSEEGIIYGNAVEGYSEVMFNKLRQAEITTLNALIKSDEARLFFLSRQNAILLSYIVSNAETMNGDRLTQIVRAIAPKSGWPIQVSDFRRILQIKVCRMSVVIPDVSSELVGACLPWLEISSSHEDDFEMALMLIEHGMYGSSPDMPVLMPEVLNWLQNVHLSEESQQIRHGFAQRISSHPRLTDEERQILQSL